VLYETEAGTLAFAELPPPSDDDIRELLLRVATRIEQLVALHIDDEERSACTNWQLALDHHLGAVLERLGHQSLVVDLDPAVDGASTLETPTLRVRYPSGSGPDTGRRRARRCQTRVITR